MKISQAYDAWATQYDTNQNATRDLEAQALRSTLAEIPFQNCLEIGCGTGKNTEWLVTNADQTTAVDFSAEMLARARAKFDSTAVEFVQADINAEWDFRNRTYDLVTFSLVLEHIEDLDHVFREASRALAAGGHVYVGELHPVKQYLGSKARFETDTGVQVVECFTHHISDFVRSAKRHGLALVELNELFDQGDRPNPPRLLTMLFKKSTVTEEQP